MRVKREARASDSYSGAALMQHMMLHCVYIWGRATANPDSSVCVAASAQAGNIYGILDLQQDWDQNG